LQPKSIDDSAVERQLAGFSYLRMPAARLQLAYEVDTANFLKKLMQARGQDMNATVAMEAGRRRGQLRKAARDERVQLSPCDWPLSRTTASDVQSVQTGDMPLGGLLSGGGENWQTPKSLRAADFAATVAGSAGRFLEHHFNLDVKKGGAHLENWTSASDSSARSGKFSATC
jgi:hypothetical protein